MFEATPKLAMDKSHRNIQMWITRIKLMIVSTCFYRPWIIKHSDITIMWHNNYISPIEITFPILWEFSRWNSSIRHESELDFRVVYRLHRCRAVALDVHLRVLRRKLDQLDLDEFWSHNQLVHRIYISFIMYSIYISYIHIYIYQYIFIMIMIFFYA